MFDMISDLFVTNYGTGRMDKCFISQLKSIVLKTG